MQGFQHAVVTGTTTSSSATGWASASSTRPTGGGAFKEGHGDGFQHYVILFPKQEVGVLHLTNSHNGESLFDHLLRPTIADTWTPLEWEGYARFDRPGAGRFVSSSRGGRAFGEPLLL